MYKNEILIKLMIKYNEEYEKLYYILKSNNKEEEIQYLIARLLIRGKELVHIIENTEYTEYSEIFKKTSKLVISQMEDLEIIKTNFESREFNIEKMKYSLKNNNEMTIYEENLLNSVIIGKYEEHKNNFISKCLPKRYLLLLTISVSYLLFEIIRAYYGIKGLEIRACVLIVMSIILIRIISDILFMVFPFNSLYLEKIDTKNINVANKIYLNALKIIKKIVSRDIKDKLELGYKMKLNELKIKELDYIYKEMLNKINNDTKNSNLYNNLIKKKANYLNTTLLIVVYEDMPILEKTERIQLLNNNWFGIENN